MKPFQPRQLLVVGPAWVGDMVMAQSLFTLLKGRHPQLEIDVLAPGWSLPLLARMPEVRDAIEMPVGHGALALGARRRLGRALLPYRYDWSIVLPNSLKSALVPFWAAIPRRTGFIKEPRWGLINDPRRLEKRRLTMTVQRFLALGLEPGEPLPPIPPPRLTVSPRDAETALARLGLTRPERLLILCPGAEFGPAKRWPEEHYAEVARTRMAQGWRVWLLGSEKDFAVGEAIRTAVGDGCLNLAGRTTLGEAIDLLSLADAVVSNDSGLMHVAAALDRPLVALYGSSDPGFTPPLHARHRILTLGLECSPCFKRDCPKGHLRCLTELSPQRALAALEELAP